MLLPFSTVIHKMGAMRCRSFFLFGLAAWLSAPGTSLYAQLPPPDEPVNEAPVDEEAVTETVEKLQGDLGEDIYRIVIKGEIDLNYVFAESPDSFVVTYKYQIEGEAKNQVDLIKDKAVMTTGIEGFLAKWPTGECALQVSVGEFPFELTFNKVEEDLIRLDLRLPGDILEKWESDCSFIDAPGSKFHTSGNPEKWVMRAMTRAIPPLTDLTLPIDRLHRNVSTMGFEIESLLIPDPPLGSGELTGKGTVQIIPERL